MVQEVKDVQGSKLQAYDWYYTRKADVGTAVPSAVQTYRDSVRSNATALEASITAAADMAALQAINTSDGWPEDLEI